MKSIVFKLNEFSLELKNIKMVNGHDDSLPFVANVFLNGNELGEANNDGWGGDANIYITTKNDDVRATYNHFIDILNNTTWRIIECNDGTKIDSKYNIGFLVDCMAFNALVLNQTEYK